MEIFQHILLSCLPILLYRYIMAGKGASLVVLERVIKLARAHEYWVSSSKACQVE